MTGANEMSNARTECSVLACFDGETTIRHIASRIGRSDTTVSRLLRLLRAAGVVERISHGRYRLT